MYNQNMYQTGMFGRGRSAFGRYENETFDDYAEESDHFGEESSEFVEEEVTEEDEE